MKVKQLMKTLESYSPDAEVIFNISGKDGNVEVESFDFSATGTHQYLIIEGKTDSHAIIDLLDYEELKKTNKIDNIK